MDAKPDAVDYYAALGFIPLESVAGKLGDRTQPVPMFLAIRFIERAKPRNY